MLKSDPVQTCHKVISLLRINALQLFIIFRSEVQSDGCGLLKRRRCPDGQEIVDFFCPLNHFLRPYQITQPPSRNRICLGEGIAGNCPLIHPRKPCHMDVYIRFENDMFIHFVRHDVCIVFFRKLTDI